MSERKASTDTRALALLLVITAMAFGCKDEAGAAASDDGATDAGMTGSGGAAGSDATAGSGGDDGGVTDGGDHAGAADSGSTRECQSGASRSVACGAGRKGQKAQRCVNGAWSDEGACVLPACQDDDERQVDCGLNGAGERTEICSEGEWVEHGACDDPDECMNGASENVPCGEQGEGMQEQSCINGSWQATSGCVPTGWTCAVDRYGAGDGCDCGCGEIDLDCAGSGAGLCDNCDEDSCAEGECALIDDEDIGSCIDIPAEWTCSPLAYMDVLCDCGCGVVDPSCADNTIDSCDSCSAESCADELCLQVDPDDNASCLDVPEGWTCLAADYDANDGCDCGCGLLDPDCGGDTSVGACHACGYGSCGGDECQWLDPEDNTKCTELAGWTCDPLYYDAKDGCDCACGVRDPDCELPGAPVYGCEPGQTCSSEGQCTGT